MINRYVVSTGVSAQRCAQVAVINIDLLFLIRIAHLRDRKALTTITFAKKADIDIKSTSPAGFCPFRVSGEGMP